MSDHAAKIVPDYENGSEFGREKAIVVITGMHRSGTSATGGLLQILGLNLPGELMGGNEFNAKGYFENQRIVEFHDALLARLGTRHDELWTLSDRELDRLRADGAVEDLAHILRTEMADHALSVFKDPRSCRFIPLWAEASVIVGAELLFAVPLRDPMEVAASLSKRDRLPQSHGLLLWLNHVLEAEHASRGYARSFFPYANLLSNWWNVTAQISRDLDLRYPRDRHEAAPEIDAFLAPELQHHSARIEDEASDDLRLIVRNVWQALVALCDDSQDDHAQATLDGVRERVLSTETLYGELMHEGAARFRSLELHAVEVGRQVAERDQRVVELHEYAQRADAEINRLERERQSENHQLATAQGALSETGRKLRNRERQLQLRERSLNEANHELQALRSRSSATERNLVDSLRMNEALREELHIILRSNAWRATRLAIRLAGQVPHPLRRRLRDLLRAAYRSAVRFRNAGAAVRNGRAVQGASERLRPEVRSAAGGNSAKPSIVGRRMEPTADDLRSAAIVQNSVLFDAASYPGADEARELGYSPALHYVLVGEAKGYAPSTGFDPVFYGHLYPEFEHSSLNRLEHYILHGMREGRQPVSATGDLYLPPAALDSTKPTVLVISHEATRTGAPILSWNIVRHLRPDRNVVTLLLSPGDLTEHFVADSDVLVGPLTQEARGSAAEATYIVERLVRAYPIDFVIANSIATHVYATAFSRRNVPVVTLSHEFATYMRPHGVLNEVFTRSSEVVFSADIVRRQSEEEYPILAAREVRVLPQGQCLVPGALDDDVGGAGTAHRERAKLSQDDEFLVVGLGTVEFRKGVDLFVSAAAAAVRARPDLKFRFVWYGQQPSWLAEYASYVEIQRKANGLEDCLEIRGPVSDLGPIYAQADVVALTSRLDPLPNISIDAATAGIPVVCFENASGFAEIMAQDPQTAALVVPYLDTTAAGQLIAELASDRGMAEHLGREIARLAKQTFDMEAYVSALVALGQRSVDRTSQRALDAETIMASPDLDLDFYKGYDFARLSEDEALSLYLSQPHNAWAVSRSDRDPEMRSPTPGFHPLRFAYEYEAHRPGTGSDPLADYIRAGRPEGPWKIPVIVATAAPVRPARNPSTVVHGHFHYPELVPEFLEAFRVNRLPCDLFITVTHADAVASVEEEASRFENGDVTVRLVPNRGRDVGPFLTEVARSVSRYEIVGHLHGKRSVFLENRLSNYGNRWREFLWQHLIGPDHAMADAIVAQMVADPSLGLVFPADPHLVGWSSNRRIAEELAERLGLRLPLPPFFTFPIGTMFWARTKALEPLFGLGLDWSDYPQEPVGEDGTLLHALERIIPHVVDKEGFTAAATYVKGVVR